MKKIAVFLLSVCLCLISFSGCGNKPETNVWDGTVAESFAKGDGSEKSPFIIKKASQLAYLASEINSGKDYTGKYISLACDLDLNHLEWTPIGNGSHSFKGIFNGNNFSILNLNISTPVDHLDETFPRPVNCGYIGLFSNCENATLHNLNIKGATISVSNSGEYEQFYAGVLAGKFDVTSKSTIHSITLSSCSISILHADDKEAVFVPTIAVGGMVGRVSVLTDAEYRLSHIQNDITITLADFNQGTNYAGGIVGIVNNRSSFICKDIANYLTVLFPHNGLNYAGAFGSFSNGDGTVDFLNVISKVTVDGNIFDIFNENMCTVNAIIGHGSQGKSNEGAVIGKYEFKNLFGCVLPYNNTSSFSDPIYKLYNLPSHTVFTEENCQGCITLPVNHGLDPNIWDVSDLSNPIIK